MAGNGTSPSSQWGIALRRFRRDKAAMAGFIFIAIATLVAIFGYLIVPDSTPYANDQKPELHIREPGFEAKFLLVMQRDGTDQGWMSKLLFGRASGFQSVTISNYKFENDKILIEEYTGDEPTGKYSASYNIAGLLFKLDITKPVKFDAANNEMIYFVDGEQTQSKSSIPELQKRIEEERMTTRRFLLGTDRLGRDLLSRLVIGTRISLAVGLVAVLISIFIGILLGAIAGYSRGFVDSAIMWLINVVWSIPTLLLVIAITLVLGKGITQVFIAVGLTMWVDVARVVRGQVLGIREREFVEAGKALGFSTGRIIFRHILPNVMGPVIVMAASNFATAILMEAGLSFLGLGAQPPIPSWGEMTNAHHGYILMDKAYLAFIPGAAIMTLVLSFMLVGNGLRDALDARGLKEIPAGA